MFVNENLLHKTNPVRAKGSPDKDPHPTLYLPLVLVDNTTDNAKGMKCKLTNLDFKEFIINNTNIDDINVQFV